MNVENLFSIINTFNEELKTTQILQLINQITSHLQNQINQPQQPNHQQQLSSARKTIMEKLNSTKSNDYSPSWNQVLDKLGFKDLRGKFLASKIEETFSSNTITPAAAHQEFTKISQMLTQKSQAMEQIISGFKVLNIEMDEPKPGECEIGVLIPRLAVNEKINGFISELKEIAKIVSDFNELTTGSRPEVHLKAIASSDYQILLDIIPVTAVALLIALEKIIKIYKDIIDIRKAHKELSNKGIPQENLRGIEDYANTKMAAGIAEGIKELIAKFGEGLEPGRKKEMEISLRYSLNKISNRIDNGFNFDVKMKESKKGEGKEKKKEDEYYKIIQEKSRELEFMNLTGNKILSLPEKKTEKKKTNE